MSGDAPVDRKAMMRRFGEQQRFFALAQSRCESPLLDIDLTMQQLRTLVVIAQGEALTGQGLAVRLGVSAATVSGLVKRLQTRGLVRREPSPRDQRAKVIVLTTEGAALLTRLDALGSQLWADVLADLDDADLMAMVSLMDKIVAIVHRRAAQR